MSAEGLRRFPFSIPENRDRLKETTPAKEVMVLDLQQSPFLALLREVRGTEDTIRSRQFAGETLERLDLEGFEFEDVVWRDCRFICCDFTHAAFYRAFLENCLFSQCRFRDSYWRDSALKGCKVDGGDFLGSRWKGCRLSETSLRYGNFARSQWERVTLCRCDLRETALSEMRLSKMALERVDLAGAELFRTSLAGVDLSTCSIEGLVVSEGCRELRGARIGAEQDAEVAHLLGVEII